MRRCENVSPLYELWLKYCFAPISVEWLRAPRVRGVLTLSLARPYSARIWLTRVTTRCSLGVSVTEADAVAGTRTRTATTVAIRNIASFFFMAHPRAERWSACHEGARPRR